MRSFWLSKNNFEQSSFVTENESISEILVSNLKKLYNCASKIKNKLCLKIGQLLIQ